MLASRCGVRRIGQLVQREKLPCQQLRLQQPGATLAWRACICVGTSTSPTPPLLSREQQTGQPTGRVQARQQSLGSCPELGPWQHRRDPKEVENYPVTQKKKIRLTIAGDHDLSKTLGHLLGLLY